MNETPKDNPLLLQLILVFQQTAWQSLGKIQNPQTGKTEVDLGAASHAIDMLAMLQTKTRGNLTDAEEKILSNALTQLQLNYVEVKNEKPAGSDSPAGGAESGPEAADSADSKPDSE